MKCPKCLYADNDNAGLSVVCNMWPLGTHPSFVYEHCVCGHPWLETAEADYRRWDHGRRESDEDRDERNKYPSVEDWFNTMKGAA